MRTKSIALAATAAGGLSLLLAAHAGAATGPSATTQAPTSITATAATLTGTASAGSADAFVGFQYGRTKTYGSGIYPAAAQIAAGTIGAHPGATIADLQCSTTYHYRIVAWSWVDIARGADRAFTTLPCAAAAPLVTTGAASNVIASGAVLNATVTPNGATTTVSFEYGASSSYGATVVAIQSPIASTAGATAVSASVAGLACATTYHFRVNAANSGGASSGADQSFTTAACEPPPPPPPVTGAYPWPTWTGQAIAVPPSGTGFTYHVATSGSDANDGRSTATAFRTVAKAVSAVQPGDTALIHAGRYREGIDLSNAPGGTAARPITFGSYGDGEVILDGSTAVSGWTLVSGTVWQAQASFRPIGVVVNDVPLRQVTQGQGGSSAPQVGVAGVTSGSGKWHVSSGNLITADFGTTLGSGNPNAADIVVPNNNGAQYHVFFYGDYYAFKGLTIRGAGGAGIWGYGSNVTIESCDIKFNGKGGVSFENPSGSTVFADNRLLTSRIYHNVLLNWPRGNNGYMEAGGGWPAAVNFSENLRGVARGNIVHMNGGEGLNSYGSASGHASGNTLFEQNVLYDNWSVSIHFDNQPHDVARENYLFSHPTNNADYLYVGAYPYDSPGKATVCVMLSDEQASSDSTNGYANLDYTQVYNNVMAGCRIGIRDYAEGSTATRNHGLKNALIANNTIIMRYTPVPNAETYGIYLQDNKAPSGTQRNVNSVIQNNVVYGFNEDAVVFSELAGAQGGIVLDYNDYFSTAAEPFGSGYNTVTFRDFAGWKAATPGADAHSLFADPLLTDVTAFRAPGTAVWNYTMAQPTSASPTLNAGTPQAFSPAVNFAGATRAGWNIGAF